VWALGRGFKKQRSVEIQLKDVVKEAKYIETERIQNKAFYTGVLKNYTDREKMVKEFGFVSLEKFEL
jgi:hypothetical protein